MLDKPPGHAKAITDNQDRRSRAAKDGLRLAWRFGDHQDMILRLTANVAVGFTSNQAERDLRPAKVQHRSSGGCWNTLEGFADFAIVQPCLSTAANEATTRLPSCSLPDPGYQPRSGR
jgi:transposase